MQRTPNRLMAATLVLAAGALASNCGTNAVETNGDGLGGTSVTGGAGGTGATGTTDTGGSASGATGGAAAGGVAGEATGGAVAAGNGGVAPGGLAGTAGSGAAPNTAGADPGGAAGTAGAAGAGGAGAPAVGGTATGGAATGGTATGGAATGGAATGGTATGGTATGGAATGGAATEGGAGGAGGAGGEPAVTCLGGDALGSLPDPFTTCTQWALATFATTTCPAPRGQPLGLDLCSYYANTARAEVLPALLACFDEYPVSSLDCTTPHDEHMWSCVDAVGTNACTTTDGTALCAEVTASCDAVGAAYCAAQVDLVIAATRAAIGDCWTALDKSGPGWADSCTDAFEICLQGG